MALAVVGDSYGESGPRILLLGLPSALIVAALVLVEAWHDLQSRLGRALQYVGAASYTLYLVHPFVISGWYLVWIRFGIGRIAGPSLYVAATFVVAVAFSIVALALIERPLSPHGAGGDGSPGRVAPVERAADGTLGHEAGLAHHRFQRGRCASPPTVAAGEGAVAATKAQRFV